MPTFSPFLEETLHRALALTNERKHKISDVEHLLLALLDDDDARDVLINTDVDIDGLREQLETYLDEDDHERFDAEAEAEA
ncbi:MAG: ATP-dependent Clp protease ATP-binding subunit ClpA, partial [Alphaproteobacteria bacterium]|nr:ATP-dependent Clp protease ATP-binding subunit ClpA [Alphaproteobacteria bacterium]